MNFHTQVYQNKLKKSSSWDVADAVIKHVYPGKRLGYWGEEHIPNWGILRGSIERVIREARKI